MMTSRGGPGDSIYSRVQLDDVETNLDHLNENLVGPSPGQVVPTATSVPIMRVTAPATLPEGYEFEASVGERVIKVQVPRGGIEEGQSFEVPLPMHMEAMMTGVSIPVGHWRDGLCNLFRYGACHPHCWTGCCCHLLAAGQVIARLKYNVCGTPAATAAEAALAAKIIFASVVVYFAVYIGLDLAVLWLYTPPPMGTTMEVAQTNAWTMCATIKSTWHYLYWIVTTVLLTRLRQSLRHKYAIPVKSCEMEDCCCSCWCPCLVSAQMLRHTTDYDIYPATCCTETGLPPHVPSIA